ncbi:uncharacterized protein LOC107759840 [Nicotiana tabacum]|uniref:Uncharacterized protein n=2 Tax=Nicotiana TaxID=4085 RepID=A0A1S3X0C8_TOBAC|nr:PREDICTED: uncharacterized protein LOC104240141 [Nicotiana sylvestris]XP_009793222.1 PREDICTED: uncharacterized protein LOC104240141 [Nicotiana sylvestris]XP_016433339.1 PREDICTED: uncharacterized protein LOC107759840 [Nicotiana tabacum]XP_016433340.1 PREDICTED: uncharacterized protein LOC107759840 [Nicotiana tabacum]
MMQFLNGLSDTYDQARRQILMKTTEPTLNQAYAIIIQDRSQWAINNNTGMNKVDPLALQVGRGQPYRWKKQPLQCEHCHMRGHAKENCYKLIGHLDDYKNKIGGYQPRNGQGRGIITASNNDAGSTNMNTPVTSYTRSGDYFFTEVQYQQILNLLSKNEPRHRLRHIWVKEIGRENDGLYLLKGKRCQTAGGSG